MTAYPKDILKCRFSGSIFDLLNQKPGDGGGGQNSVLGPPDDPDSYQCLRITASGYLFRSNFN